MGGGFAVGVAFDEELEDAAFVEVVDGGVGSEDWEPGAGWSVLSEDGV